MFTIPTAGTAGSNIQINFAGAAAKVRSAIYSHPATSGPLLSSLNAVNSATISLNGLAAGTYYLRVFGNAACSYTAVITP